MTAQQPNSCPIILIDSNPGDVRLMMEAATEHGNPLEGCVCSSGTEFIERLNKGEIPRVALFELHMQGVSGFDLLKILKNKPEWRHIAAIAYGSQLSPQDIEQAYASNANCVVSRPRSYEQLSELIRIINEFWLKWAVPQR